MKLQHIYSLRHYFAMKKKEVTPVIATQNAFWGTVKEKKQGREMPHMIIFKIILNNTKQIFFLHISLHRNTVCIHRLETHAVGLGEEVAQGRMWFQQVLVGISWWHRGLRTQRCQQCGSGCCCDASSIPGPRISPCCKCGQNKTKQEKKKKQVLMLSIF